MFQYFNRNTFGAYLAIPILTVLFRLRLILYPERGFTTTDGDLYTPLWNMLLGGVSEACPLSVGLSIVLTVFSAWMVIGLSNRYHFSDSQSCLSGMLFVIMSSAFVESHGLHPIHLFCMLFLMSLYCLFSESESERPMSACFNAAMMYSVACLFWGKAVWFFPLLVVVMVILRMWRLRCWLALLLGVATPVLSLVTYFYCKDTLFTGVDQYWRSVTSPVSFFRTGAYTRTYLVLYSTLVIAGLLGAMRQMPKLKIIESRYYRVMMWVIFLSAFLIVLPHFSFEMLTVVAIGGSIFIASYMQKMRSALLQEIILGVVIASTLYIQWVINR